MSANRFGNRLPPLNALRAFEASARHLNFRLAAEELFVTQGAVAQQVRHLEKVLEKPLFHRMPRGLALTEAGAVYFADIQRALETIAVATDNLMRQSSGITVSTTPSLASKWLIPHLSSFQEAFPHVDVKVIASEKVSSFQKGEADLAIRLGRPPFDKELEAELLFPLDVYVVCSPHRKEGAKPLREPADLADQVLLHDAHSLWDEFIHALKLDVKIDTRKGPRFNQSALAIDAAIAGQGVALASDPLVERDILLGRLYKPFDISLRQALGFYIVYPKERKHSETILSMRNWLFAQAKMKENL
ncbi:transcriptional regulator GcvA [Leeia oryzae]|uniref:transcriptional regulator GcvA n=1 Tax=Leeia oryzae TaxID=356662 RepID=UPI00036ECF9F|nr:transcriptional regulator GcvA [Leeia oryzae]